MELLSVRLARVIAFFPTDELNPRGRRLLDDVLPAFIERYDFRKHPEKPDDYDEVKGIKFEVGKWNDAAIVQFVFYGNGIMVDTISSTDDSEAMLRDALTWTAESFKLHYRPDMLNRIVYVSELAFRSDVSLEAVNPKLKRLTDRLTNYISAQEGQALPFEPVGIAFGVDTLKIKIAPTALRIERLQDSPFTEMKYYSQAPLPTAEHIKFLEDFEAVLIDHDPIY